MNLTGAALRGILLPFWGTAGGAVCVLFLRGGLGKALERAMAGFAAGVMTASSIWSLLEPALEQAGHLGCWSFVPAVAGLWTGVLFLLLLDELVPGPGPEQVSALGKRNRMLALAVTLHNVPEGMAVGVVYAGLRSGTPGISAAGALALAAGIAIQNVPEGAIVSLPLRAEGMGKGRALLWGILSGAVEPLAAVLTLLLAPWIAPLMPCLLSFAAGAMLCVVVEELVPEMNAGGRSSLATLSFTLGFCLMMALDVVFG